MPEFRSALKSRLQKSKDELPQGLMREVLETYKPNLLTRRRRLIEDFVRDLMLNNDHIHVMELPNGQEQGKFLSLDLGGTNFRVIFMELTAQKEFMMDSKIYAIPHSVMIGPGVELFDHIADCLANFVFDRKIQDLRYPPQCDDWAR